MAQQGEFVFESKEEKRGMTECVCVCDIGANLQNYNNELVRCLEELRERREALNKDVSFDQTEPFSLFVASE